MPQSVHQSHVRSHLREFMQDLWDRRICNGSATCSGVAPKNEPCSCRGVALTLRAISVGQDGGSNGCGGHELLPMVFLVESHLSRMQGVAHTVDPATIWDLKYHFPELTMIDEIVGRPWFRCFE